MRLTGAWVYNIIIVNKIIKAMKKVLVFAMTAVVALAFTSCKQEKKDDPKTSVKITLSEHELTMKVDDQTRMKATVEPAGTEVTMQWKSTATDVATVNSSGLVTAVGNGEALIIVSAEGATGDTCKITVTSTAAYEIYDVAGYGLFGDFEEIAGTDTILRISVGEVNVRLNKISLLAWDGNLNYVKGSGWSGDGLLTEGEISVYLIVAGEQTDANAAQYVGYYISSGGFGFANLKNAGYDYYPYYGQSGKIDVQNYGKFLSSLIHAESSEDIDRDALDNMVSGAYVYEVDADNDDWYSYYPFAVIDNLEIEENDDDTFEYGADVTWSNLTDDDRYFGLKVVIEEVEGQNTITDVVTPYDYATVGPMHFGTLTFSNEAPKYYLGDMKKVHKEMPTFVKNIRTDRMYRK